ncbi:unnamed protein product [Lampetra fluviatilis]
MDGTRAFLLVCEQHNFALDSGEDSSPWDSPLPSERDPVKKAAKDKKRSKTSEGGSSTWESEEEPAASSPPHPAVSPAQRQAPPQGSEPPTEPPSRAASRPSTARSLGKAERPAAENQRKPAKASESLDEPEMVSRLDGGRDNDGAGRDWGGSGSAPPFSSFYESVQDSNPPVQTPALKGTRGAHKASVYEPSPSPPDPAPSLAAKVDNRGGLGRLFGAEHGFSGSSQRLVQSPKNVSFAMEPSAEKRDTEEPEVVSPVLTSVVCYRDLRYMYSYQQGPLRSSRPPVVVEEDAYMMQLADRWEVTVRRFYRELFGALWLLVATVAVFVVELAEFAGRLARTLLVGLAGAASDYLLRPALTVSFNGLLRPAAAFTRSLLLALAEAARPLLALAGEAVDMLARTVRAFRLVEVNVVGRNLRTM